MNYFYSIERKCDETLGEKIMVVRMVTEGLGRKPFAFFLFSFYFFIFYFIF